MGLEKIWARRNEFFNQMSTWLALPMGSMYGIFTYIWVIYGVNVGKYSIHGSYGLISQRRCHTIPNISDHPLHTEELDSSEMAPTEESSLVTEGELKRQLQKTENQLKERDATMKASWHMTRIMTPTWWKIHCLNPILWKFNEFIKFAQICLGSGLVEWIIPRSS